MRSKILVIASLAAVAMVVFAAVAAVAVFALVGGLAVQLEAIEAALQRAGLDVPDGLRGDRDGLLDLGMSLHVAPRFAEDRITFVRDFPASQR